MMLALKTALALGFLVLPTIAAGKDCSVTSIGFIPLNDLGSGEHLGEQGGLYPGGANFVPIDHLRAGLERAQAIAESTEPVVMISIGMSNTFAEFGEFLRQTQELEDLHPNLTIINTSQGGQHACKISNPQDGYWQGVEDKVLDAGRTVDEVRVAWMKQACAGPEGEFPQHPLLLEGELNAIVQIAKDRFPNLDLLFCSSRTYAGYADTALNPEPYAYESGFSVKWLIEDQIHGQDSGLFFDPDQGTVEAPWLGWGAYLWADGLIPRSDDLVWECDDLANDGTHPSPQGSEKVAGLLMSFLTADPLARPWFVAGGATDIADGALGVRANLSASPNPFRTEVSFRWGQVAVPLEIIDATGRVRARVSPNSETTWSWNGIGTNGDPVPAGIYFARPVGSNDMLRIVRTK